MKNWFQVAVSPFLSIKDVVDVIDKSSLQIALVVDQDNCLLGTVTDGDVRRGLLKGLKLEDSVDNIYNKNPFFVNKNTDRESLYLLMKRNFIKQVPVVDENNRVVELVVLKELLHKKVKKNPVIIMAGGLGSRLRPLTNDCPKPLLKVGGKPILEIIVEKFIEEGFENFYFSVNYKAEMIKKYFGDGSKWNISIGYLEEDKKLGTAGSLSLIPIKPQESIIVMNGDLLTKVNFNHLLSFHTENKSFATMCVRDYEIQIPYGVVKIKNADLLDIQEKPVNSFFVNAGIYVLNPDVLDMVPSGKYYDMTDLFNKIIKRNLKSSVFPIKEYWLDIGRVQDFEAANFEYGQLFSKS